MLGRYSKIVVAVIGLAVSAGPATGQSVGIRVQTGVANTQEPAPARPWDGRRHRDTKHPRVIIVYADRPLRPAAQRPEPEPVSPVALPPQPAETAEPVNLDPAGASRIQRARNAPAGPGSLQIGARLPPSLPHVTLNRLHYDLPEPAQGQIYARVRGGVYVIDAATRRVIAAVDPLADR